MSAHPVIVVYKESLAESVMSDVVTFGFLLLCIWASQGNTWWTFFTGVLFLIYVAATTPIKRAKAKQLYSTDQLRALADQIDKEAA